MTLGDLIKREQVIPQISATDKWTAIDELIDHLESTGRIKPEDKPAILEAVREREKSMSTGVGFGIGIPHASSERIEEVVAAFGRSAEGIEFDSFDNAPVHFIVLFVSPKDKFQAHLRTLSSIAKTLNRRELRESLASASSAEEIHEILKSRSLRAE